MATIKDVAKKAGVSVGTVSNMLNGKGGVSDEKYDKIQEAIEELSYKPNYMAQNLKKHKGKVIGVLLPSLEEPYNDIYQGIADVLDMNNYILILKLTQNNIVLENHFLEQLLYIGMVGAIIVPCDQRNKEKYGKLQNQGIKIVMVERKLEGIDFSNVLFENKQLIFDITNSLIEENPYREIRLMVGKKEFSNEQDCVEGYLAARENREQDIIVIEETRKEAVFDRIYQKLIEGERFPECVITSSMEFATHLSEVCNILKLKLEIHSIVGEKWYTTDLYKDITQYGRNAILMGKEAGKLLASIMKSRGEIENRSIYIHPKRNYRNTGMEIHTMPMRSLRVLAFQCDATDALEKLSCAFRNITGIRVEFDKLEYSSLRKELYIQTRGKKTDYDIIMMDLPWIRSVLSENYLENIKEWAKRDNFLANFPSGIRQDFYRGDCGVHLIPIIATIQMILYRKDVFNDRDIKKQFQKQYGYELMPPKTWTNFNTIAEFFDKKTNVNSPFQYGTAATALEPVGLINEFLPRQWAFHGRIADKWGKLVIDSEENQRALDNLVKTFQFVPKEAEGYFWDELFKMLLYGEIPIVQGFASHYQPGKHSQNGDTYEKYIGQLPLPGGKTMLGGWALGINRYSDRIKESYEFLKWNLNDKVAITNLRLCGCLPTVSVIRDETLRGSYPWLNLVDEKFQIGGSREELFDKEKKRIDLEQIDYILSGQIKRAINQEIDSKTALIEMKKELENMLKVNNRKGDRL